MPQAVIFDAFGTLLRINGGGHPYGQLMKIGKMNGRKPRSDDSSILMRLPLTLTQVAKHLEIPADPADLRFLEMELAQEIAAVEPYPDGIAAIQLLQSMNVRVGVCSNLAFPYKQAILRCYPGLDAYAFSCELGITKPDPAIYKWVCNYLGISPAATWMVGDSMRCDKSGPLAAGICGFYLDRVSGRGDCADLLSFARRAVGREP